MRWLRFRNPFEGNSAFQREVRHELRLLITVTLAFTIAFTWRQTIFDSMQHVVQLITHIQGAVSLSIATSAFITIVSVALIFLTSKLLKDPYPL